MPQPAACNVIEAAIKIFRSSFGECHVTGCISLFVSVIGCVEAGDAAVISCMNMAELLQDNQRLCDGQ